MQLKAFVVVLISKLVLFAVPAVAQNYAQDAITVENHMNALLSASPPNITAQTVIDGYTELYFEGPDYQGLPTKVFAIYREPDTPLTGPDIATGKAPAVVLVHGGGGSAFKDWVAEWNAAGFAAISIAVEGQTNQKDANGKWVFHPDGGPARSGIYQDRLDANGQHTLVEDQWMFHAVSAAINANTLLRSFPNVDSRYVGISGISWGGVITSTVMGYDNRFDFAIPIYGAGNLDEMANQYYQALADNDQYDVVWEPNNRIANFTKPSLWMNWQHDVHFSLDTHAATYRNTSGVHVVSIQEDLKHGHAVAWNRPGPYEFARRVVLDGQTWVRPLVSTMTGANGDRALARWRFFIDPSENDPNAELGYRIERATIHYTNAGCHTGFVEWQKAELDPANLTKVLEEAVMRPDGTVANQIIWQAHYDGLPSDAVYWFINLEVDIEPDMDDVDGDGATDTFVSSELYVVP